MDIENLNEISEKHRKRLLDAEQNVRENTVNQYLRWKEVDNSAYTGNAYQLEIYQEEDLQFSVKGLTSQDIENLGRQVNFIDPV